MKNEKTHKIRKIIKIIKIIEKNWNMNKHKQMKVKQLQKGSGNE